LRIMFADEARFGRINRPRPCWAPIGTRPEVASQLIREYVYLYGAVSPKDGTCVYLIMPRSDTACFQAFLNVLSRKFARQDILLVLDGAPNHRCSDLALPDNISLLFLPPYSPELNPKENLWDEIREKSSRTTRSNQSTPCAPNSSRRSSTSNAIPQWSNPLRLSPISQSHSDVEMGITRRFLTEPICAFSAAPSCCTLLR
jgi:transposase